MPRRLLLTAGDGSAVHQQLGLSEGEEVAPLDVDELPLTPGLRRQINTWASTFLDLRSLGATVESSSSWAEQGFAVASALAGELNPDVQLRFVAAGMPFPIDALPPIDQPMAGLFEDRLGVPVIPMKNGWTAYQSTLSLEFGGEPGAPDRPEPWLTASRTDATDDELGELRRRAVDPVVRSLLTPAELAGVSIIVYQPDGTREISLRLEAMGEEMRHWIFDPDVGGEMPDIISVARRFADSMEDWVCETRFAWGQRRIADYRVPPTR